MIPLRDNIPTRRFPVVSVTLIVLNVVVFLLDRLTGSTQIVHAITPDGIPVAVSQFEGGLSAQYSMIPAVVTSHLDTAWVTIFTSMFLHANLLHIGGNMLYLWIFGNNVEDTLGRGRFLVFYLVCGVAAAAAHILSDPQSTVPTIGASGAIAGVMGAYIVLWPDAQILSLVPFVFISTLMEVPALIVIGFWAVLQFINTSFLGGGMMQGQGVAYMAHVGGFVSGVVIILLLGGRRLLYQRDDRRDYYG